MYNSRITIKELINSEYRNVLVFLCGMLVMVAGMFSTVDIVPELLKSQDLGVTLLQLINTLPLVILAVMFPLGRIWVQLQSVKKTFQFTLLGFFAGSLIISVSSEFDLILLGRVVQSVSCGMLFPMIFSIISALSKSTNVTTSRKKRGIIVDRAILLATIISIGSLLLGNWQYQEWFFAGVSLITWGFSYKVKFNIQATKYKVDWHEVALSVGAPILLVWVTSLGIGALPDWVNPLFGGFSLILLVGYIVYDLTSYQPLSGLRQLIHCQYITHVFTTIIGYGSFLLLLSIGDLYLVQGLHYSTFFTALALLPAIDAFILMKRSDLVIIRRLTVASLTKTGMTILMIGWLLLSVFSSYLNLIGFIFVSVIIEVGHGLIARHALNYAVFSLPKESRYAGTLFFQQMNLYVPAIILEIFTVILQNNTELSMTGSSLPGVLSSLSGYRAVFLSYLLIVILGWFITIFDDFKIQINLKNIFK
ncbi:MFS transporter [Pediococcus claussenii]|uniref:Major Facilitator Superfamily protein n=1 Tax=Pediococcus claussenii (strain ATCC BAA-344 / DSM 14800 / JCM 18046 / KCTC 3811 / LMG 21948 / P06) TaxID=701521 RepID=G8PB60_PEDCP|nr:MFS transporter [Pediococcus claussenii]AEV94689.1 major Facilitator Superfamily protein [Pediococcus claussenii ATCC BAA-344]ANZ69884.1 hypothetical protein AYR57_05985 [Pediococcus claussenii]ANZ71701.1 hypothetical protein AYR58_05990 [Pediococcus claussenii]KRN20868.1 hypothetical protein IV79_GL000090 [Pediococcus claussenii]